ncbi:hypothetical protein HYFRA_00006663 [Hymenoscyphus fraxineus]|uniref:FAD-binding domain-containing protein n=1 Tax=Hymenoscyphus fraxineus TaxID=746836 RepID=A0A9N9KYE9_9HELO|nr:hypothetical protein HYFRA_00006663 [Hymenoscyphus fraxineus]
MAPTSEEKPRESDLHVLIAGAGIVGLTLAQGCKKHGIPFTIFERDVDRISKPQGWALTLHWSLNSLRRTIDADLAKDLTTATVDPTLKLDSGNFLFLNAETGETRYKIPPTKERLRLNRLKLLNLLSKGLDIQWGKIATSFKDLPDGTVEVNFQDGSVATGSMLIGADGNHSKMRKSLIKDETKSSLTELPIRVLAAVRHFTYEQGLEARALDPLLFSGLNPTTSNYVWYSVQEVFEQEDGRNPFDALVLTSWEFKDPENDVAPSTNKLRVAYMKERAKGFTGPIRRLFEGIPDDSERITSLTLADYPSLDWESNPKVTLAGDAAHAMTMYRGEGANHGILDAALLIDQLIKVKSGEVDQKRAIEVYEEEMKPRCKAAVLKSRQACLDGHNWNHITDDSPLIGGRWPPATA